MKHMKIAYCAMSFALAFASGHASALNCTPATPQTTIIYCNDFEISNTSWAANSTYYQMDSTVIATRYGGTETHFPGLTINGAAAPSGSQIRQQNTVETIQINDPALPTYTDGGALNHAIGMFDNGIDRLTFTFDARDAGAHLLPYVTLEFDAAAIPLMRQTNVFSPGVGATQRTFRASVWDESTGHFVQAGAALAPDATIVQLDSKQTLLPLSAPFADNSAIPASFSYNVVWARNIQMTLNLSALNPVTNPNGTVTVSLDHPNGTLGYLIFDNLKISATNLALGTPAPVPTLSVGHLAGLALATLLLGFAATRRKEITARMKH